MVDEAELVHPGLLDPEEVECLLMELAELDVLGYRKLTGNGSVVWLLWTVDHNFLG